MIPPAVYKLAVFLVKFFSDTVLSFFFDFDYSGGLLYKYQKHTRRELHALMGLCFLKLMHCLHLLLQIVLLMYGNWSFHLMLEVSPTFLTPDKAFTIMFRINLLRYKVQQTLLLAYGSLQVLRHSNFYMENSAYFLFFEERVY